jgi:uncharacterized membrane protein YvlD (DUF360 family)
MSFLDKVKAFFNKKSVGFYVGLAAAVLALVTMFIYIGMQSRYFTGWVIVFILLGIVLFVASSILGSKIGLILAYFCYMAGLYMFVIPEVNLRLDTIIAEGMGAVDGIFYATLVFFILTIVSAIVGSCLKQDKE